MRTIKASLPALEQLGFFQERHRADSMVLDGCAANPEFFSNFLVHHAVRPGSTEDLAAAFEHFTLYPYINQILQIACFTHSVLARLTGWRATRIRVENLPAWRFFRCGSLSLKARLALLRATMWRYPPTFSISASFNRCLHATRNILPYFLRLVHIRNHTDELPENDW